MKFAREFETCLSQGGYPPEWIHAALSYRKLKKCIKRVVEELESVGLDVETLHHLLQLQEEEHLQNDKGQDAKAVEYQLSTAESSPEIEGQTGESSKSVPRFRPKLLFAIDEQTGEPLDAGLTPATKQYLHALALGQGLAPKMDKLTLVKTESSSDSVAVEEEPFAGSPPRQPVRRQSRAVRMIEVPLTSDSEFFIVLRRELTALSELQTMEKLRLSQQVVEIGKTITAMTNDKRRDAKHDLRKWREIFRLYLEASVFFATKESDHGAHNSIQAQKALQNFSNQLKADKSLTKFKKHEGQEALDRFVDLNLEVLKALRFQEINATAMSKILKKFDKRTALDVRDSFTDRQINNVFNTTALTESVAKAVSFQISSSLLTIVPQLDDYLCPICSALEVWPVKLRCGHVFCSWCLATMQKRNQNHCPLCREEGVMDAMSNDIDKALTDYMKKEFPVEFKQKVKDNQKAWAREMYGEDLPNCFVM